MHHVSVGRGEGGGGGGEEKVTQTKEVVWKLSLLGMNSSG